MRESVLKVLNIICLALCLIAVGAAAPSSYNAMLMDAKAEDPDAIMEVFVTKQCNSFSGGISGFFKKVITGKWKKINFDYCPCIPMDIGEASSFSDILSKAWTFIKSIPAGFWSGEFDLGMQTKKPQLEDTQKKVWAEAWKADALAREMEIQEAAMLVSISMARANVYISAYNADAAQMAKAGMYNGDRNSSAFKNLMNNLTMEFPLEASDYNKIQPLSSVLQPYLNRWKEFHPYNIKAMHDAASYYGSMQNAMNSLYNELINDDGGSDALADIAELVNKVKDVIDKFKNIRSITDIQAIIDSVSGVIDLLKNIKIGKLSFNSRMLFVQIVNALLDDIVKNWKMWVAAVLDKNPLYPLEVVKDSFIPVIKDLALLLMIIPPEKGQTKELQLVMAMLDQNSALVELNEREVHKYIDLGMWGPQVEKTVKRWGKENAVRISHNASQYKKNNKTRKLGF